MYNKVNQHLLSYAGAYLETSELSMNYLIPNLSSSLWLKAIILLTSCANNMQYVIPMICICSINCTFVSWAASNRSFNSYDRCISERTLSCCITRVMGYEWGKKNYPCDRTHHVAYVAYHRYLGSCDKKFSCCWRLCRIGVGLIKWPLGQEIYFESRTPWLGENTGSLILENKQSRIITSPC